MSDSPAPAPRRDPLRLILWIAFGLHLGVAIPYLFPLLGEEAFARYRASVPMFVVIGAAVFAAFYRARRSRDDAPRRFWTLAGAGLCFFWVMQSFYAVDVRFLREHPTLWELGYLSFFLLFLLAFRFQPERAVRAGGARTIPLLEVAGAILFVVGIIFYFILAPRLVSPPVTEGRGPTSLQYAILDLVILLGFLRASHGATSPQWRRGASIWAAVFGFFLFTDLCDALFYLEVLPSLPWWLDHLYYIPFLGVVWAAQESFHPPEGAERRDHAASLGAPWSVLVAYALVFPILHFVAYMTGIMAPELRNVRSAVVLVELLTLTGLAWLYQQAMVRRLTRAELRSREAEGERRLLAAAVEQAVERIAITGPDLHLLYANPSFARGAGRGRETLLGESLLGHLSPVESDALTPAERLGLGEPWLGRSRTFSSEGGEVEEDVTITPVRGVGGELTHFIAVKRDVTAEARLERQLRQSHKMEALGTLAGGIAHDFNNVLAAIFGYVELLAPAVAKNDQAVRDLAAVQQAAERARDLVEQILAFSRRRGEDWRPVRLDRVLGDVRDLVRASAPARVEVSLDLPEELGPVRGIEPQLHQVFLNLATNAVQAVPGSGKVLLSAAHHRGPRGEEGVRVTVEDSGTGIPDAVRHRIFDPFFTTKGVGEGTGLGLAVVHGILSAHGGSIEVESEEGAGSRFHVWLPSASPELEEAPDEAQSTGEVRGVGRVWVVEDETALASVVRRRLERSGYRVKLFGEPAAALRALRSGAGPDLVITDQAMPGMSGTDLLRELRADGVDVPVILMTGFAPGITAALREELGIDVLLRKPFPPRLLAEEVARLLRAETPPPEGEETVAPTSP